MLNWIWIGMMVIAVVAGALTGRIDAVTQAALEAAKLAVEIAIGLIGIMALWLGVMKIAEAAGLVQVFARLLKPVLVRLFPDVPPDHPAMGSIVLNMAANMLGIGNAATPMGLKAMSELQELNPRKDTASNAMVMFLAINTSSVQILLPATVVALMGVAANQIFVTTLLATTCSTVAAVIAVKVLQRFKRFACETEAVTESSTETDPASDSGSDSDSSKEPAP